MPEEAATLVEPLGLVPIPKLLRGPHAGRIYPRDYTATQRKRFRRFAEHARAAYAPVLARMHEAPSINMFNDDKFLAGLPNFAGAPCDAGDRFVSIRQNGDVFRCSSKAPLGNLLRRTFAPLSGATLCDTRYCFYFCTKYSRPDSARAGAAAA